MSIVFAARRFRDLSHVVQRVVLRRHVLLLANQAIQAFDILRAQLVVLRVAVPCLHVGGAASHILELNVIRIEVLDDADVVALLVGPAVALHGHTTVAVLLHVGWDL